MSSTTKKFLNMKEHDKIIYAVVKGTLSLEGLFRIGQSRIWLDDNGYYVILVEFQPSGYEKGTYLNVGICFLWEYNENGFLNYNYGGRVLADNRQFATYETGREQ